MKAWRIAFVAAGIGLLLFGVFRLGTEIALPNLGWLVVWLAAAIAIHDGILSPVVLAVGWFLRRVVPDRARRFLQLALIISGLVTVIAAPMIYRRDSQPPVKALLLRNYGANLTLMIGIIAVVSLALYAVQVARDQWSKAAPSVSPHPPEA